MTKKILFGLVISLIVISGCGKKAEEKKFSAPSAEKLAKADSSIMLLGKTLKSALVKKIKTEGLDSAVQFCVKNAQKLTDEVNSKLNGFSVKRTSLKIRNPKNKPDKYEKEALAYFEEQIKKTGEIPEKYVQTFEREGKTYYRLYKPLKIGTPCLQCHGDPQHISDNVSKVLSAHYPEDAARDYKKGDFRGLFRSEFSE